MALKFVRWVAIFAIAIGFIFQLSKHVGELRQLPSLLLSGSLVFVAIAFLGYILEYVADGLLSKVLLQICGHRLNIKNTVRIAIIDVFAAQALPLGEAGAVATSIYFYRKLGVNNSDLVFLSVAWAIVTNIALTLLFISILPFLPLHEAVPLPKEGILLAEHIIFVLAVVIGALSMLLIFKKNLTMRLLPQRMHYLLTKIDLMNSIQTHKKNLLQHKDLVAAAVICGFCYYLGQALILYASLATFGLTPHISIVVFCLTISLLVSWITLIPGGVGVAEASLSFLLLSFNLPAAEVFAGVLLYRIFSFWTPFALGVVTYFSLRRSPLKP